MSESPTNKPWLVRMHHQMRTASFAMVFGATFLHLAGKNNSPASWAFLVMLLLIYPHVQYWRALRTKDPIRAEVANLLIDSVLLGMFIAVVAFSDWLTFSVMMGTLSNNAANRGLRGIRDSLTALLSGVLLGSAVVGFNFSPHTDWPATLFCIAGLGGYLLAMNNIGFSRNVQLRKAREQLKAYAISERKAREEQGRFIAMLSHELKTPLAVIDGAAQALERITRSHDPEVTKRHERIRRSVSRIDRLIEQFLTNDRLEVESLTVQRSQVNVVELLQQVAEMTGDSTERLRLEASGSLSLTADDALMGIAVTNLVDNALKYSPADSIVHVSAKTHEEKGCAGVEIVVTDDGPGISTDLGDRLFARYSRGENVGHISGAGLGLHLVQRIAELHGGRVETIASQKGAEFRLWLPSGTQGPP